MWTSLMTVSYTHLIVFLFFLCTIPVSVLIIVGFKGKIKTHNRAFRKEMEETSAKVMEMVEMIPVTKAHALEDQEARKMSEQLRKVAEKGLQLDMIQTYFSSISWVAFQIFQVFCLAFTAVSYTHLLYRQEGCKGQDILLQGRCSGS